MSSCGPSRAVLSASVAVAAVALLPTIWRPLGRDQALFAYIARRILEGGLPYRDVFDQKWPAVHYTYAAALSLFGDDAVGVYLLFYIVAIVGAGLAAVIASRLTTPLAAVPAAAAYALGLGQLDRWSYLVGQAEDAMLPLLLGSMLMLASTNAGLSRWPIFGANALLGACCCFKPTVLPSVVLLGLAQLRGRPISAGRPLFRLTVVAAAGLAAPLVAMTLFLWCKGILADFWYCTVVFNTQYYPPLVPPATVASVFAEVWSRWSGLLLLSVPGAIVLARRGSHLAGLVWAASIGGFLGVLWQAKYFANHWVMVIGVLAILTGVGAEAVARWVLTKLRVASTSMVAVGAILVVVLSVPEDLAGLLVRWSQLARMAKGVLSLDIYRADFVVGAGDYTATLRAARVIERSTTKDDRVFVWGNETVLSLMSHRRAANLYPTIGHYRTRFPLHEERRRELVEALRAAPPRIAVISERDPNPFSPEDSVTQLATFRELGEFLARNYRLARRVPPFHILIAADASPGRR